MNINLTHKKMIKVLFKSEELLIAADSESKVVYGNTRRNSAVKYLNELTPKSKIASRSGNIAVSRGEMFPFLFFFGLMMGNSCSQ